jgi:hypothetical protein
LGKKPTPKIFSEHTQRKRDQQMSDDNVKIDEIHTVREPGFVPLFDAERFKHAGVPTLDELKATYKTPEAMKTRVAELKRQVAAGSLRTLQLKAEMGGILFLAIASAEPGAKTGLSERMFGVSKDTAYRYIDLYKYFAWGWEAARDAAIARADAKGVEVGDIAIDEVIRLGKEAATKAGAVITRTYQGGDVLLIDPSAAEPIANAPIPANFANRKGSRDGYWELVKTASLMPGALYQEINGEKRTHFVVQGDAGGAARGFECRLMIARIDTKTKTIAPVKISNWDDLLARFDFTARKPQCPSGKLSSL